MNTDGYSERLLLAPLMLWLSQRRRIRFDTLLAQELPWHGRRVDVATLTTTRRTTAYELKLGNNRRAIEQAAYNALAFDRSFVVTATSPSGPNVELAERMGIGIILIDPDAREVSVVLEPRIQPIRDTVRRRLMAALRDRGVELHSV